MTSFLFYDYSGTLTSFGAKTEEEWKNKMKDMEDIFKAAINESFTFYLPLDRPVLNSLDWVNAGPNRKLGHEFVIFRCSSLTKRSFYLSFEKNQESITVQYSDKIITVKDNFQYKVRTQKYKLKEDEKKHFDFTRPLTKLMGLEKPTVAKIVERWKTALHYNLLTSNCQHLVNDVRDIFKKISKEKAVRLKFPGSNKDVSLSLGDQEEIIDLFNSYSEGFKNKEEEKTFLSISFKWKKSPFGVPRKDLDPLPRVIGTIDGFEYDSKDGKRLEERKMKDEIDDWIETCLDELELKGMYFTHLNRNKMKENLENASIPEKSDDLVDLEKLWKIEIDGVILSQEYGAIIINITNDTQNISENIETAEEIFLKELFNTFYPDEIKVRNITIKLSNSGLKETCKKISKRCMQMDKGCKDKDEFCKLFKRLLAETGINTQPDEQIKFLAGLLLILQNVEKADSKLFNCIINQEWETDCKYIVWSIKQREIINAMHIAFKGDSKDPKHHNRWDKEFLCKLIVGCPGSGKTLILLYAIEEYCKKWPERNALFIVPQRNTCLFKQVTSCLEKWRGLDQTRVKIRSELPSIDELTNLNVGFIAIDEFYEEEFLNKSPTSKSMHRALELGIHIWIATMDFNYELIEDFTLYNIKKSNYYDRAYMLGGANYRSNKAILQLVHKVQESQRGKDNIAVDKNHSSFMPVSGNEIKLLYMSGDVLRSLDNGQGDTGPNRFAFIKACKNYILENKSLLKKEKVLIYNICHYSLFLRIKKEVEDELSKEDENIKKNLIFGDTRACQGAQYAYSIGIYDHASVPYEPYSAIITALTRTVLSAHLLINITTQYPILSALSMPSPTLAFDVIDGTSKLKAMLLYLRNNRENFTVLYSEGDNSIDVAQIREIDNIREIKVPNFPFKKEARFESWNDVDVVVGSPKFYANYQHAWSPIHSCNATFVVTYRKKENEETVDNNNEERTNYGNNDNQNKKIRDLLVNKFNQND